MLFSAYAILALLGTLVWVAAKVQPPADILDELEEDTK